jgi:predicted amidohydrolase YtcJ
MPPEGNGTGTGKMSPDILIRNARVITCDSDFSIHDSVAISGDRIAAVGPAEVLSATRPDTHVIDAGGRAVIPGMIDGHAHLDREGLKSIYPSLSGCRSIDDILQRIEALVAKAEPGDWIVTMPIGEPPYYFGVPDNLVEKRFPTRHDLDAVSPRNPVYIRPIWGYWRHRLPITSVANTLALDSAGLCTLPDDLPETITFETDGAGALTGVIHENSFMPIVELAWLKAMPRFGPSERIQGLRQSMEIYNSTGTTSVYEEHGCAQELIDAWRAVNASGEATVRANLVYSPSWHFADKDGYEAALKRWSGTIGGNQGSGDEWLRIAGIFADFGIEPDNLLRARAAPYTGWSGFNYDSGVPRERMVTFLTELARANVRANAIWMEFLPLYEQVNEIVPLAGRRWIMGHLDRANEEQIASFAAMGIAMTSHTNRYVYKHGALFRDQIGAEHENEIAPLRSVVEAGIHIGLGTDNVPTTLWYPVWHAVTRYNMDIDGPIAPDQALTREQALRCATIEAAHLTFEEDIKGSLESGKLADLAILSDDPLSCPDNTLKDITAELTLVGGKIVHNTDAVNTS